jgi:hypothetical protein
MREEHEEGDGWDSFTDEDELILGRIHAELAAKRAKLPAHVREAQRAETHRRCEEARRYRLEQEAAGHDQGELPTGPS